MLTAPIKMINTRMRQCKLYRHITVSSSQDTAKARLNTFLIASNLHPQSLQWKGTLKHVTN